MLATIVSFDGPVPAPWVTLSTTFRYRAKDPWAVVFDLAAGGGDWIRWAFARSLLADGLTGAAGEADVIVFLVPCDDKHVYLTLSNHQSVTLRFNRVDIDAALDRCEALVPAGCEHDAVDWDREWARLGEVA